MIGRRFTSERIRKERRKRFLLHGVLICILALSVVFLVVEVVDLRQLRITKVRVEGNRATTDVEIFDVIVKRTKGSYGHLFSRQNSLLFPQPIAERELLEEFVRLKTAHIDRGGLNTLVVRVTERAPAGLWCLPDRSVSRNCYYLDSEGLAFSLAPRLSGDSFTSYRKVFPGRILREYIVPPEEFSALIALTESLMKLGFKTYEAVWREDAIDLSTRTKVSGRENVPVVLRVPLTPPYDTAYSNIASVVESKDASIKDFSVAGLEYIDLRFENKVFYKRAGNETPSIGGAATGTSQ